MNYAVSFKVRQADLSKADFDILEPEVARVRASNATRAISQVVNNLKAEGRIQGKADVVIVEAKVVA